MGYVLMLVKRIGLLLLLFLLVRFAFYALNFPYFGPIPLAHWIQIIWGGAKLDLSLLMYANVLYIFMFLIPHAYRSNRQYLTAAKVLFLFTNGICLLANLIDAAYFPFILRRTNASVFMEFSNDTALLGSIGTFVATFWPIALLALLFFLLLYKSYGYIKMPLPQQFGAKQIAARLLLLPLSALIWLGLARGSFDFNERPMNTVSAGAYVTRPIDVNLVLNTPISIFTTWGNVKVEEVSYFASLAEAAKYYQPIKQYHTIDSFSHKNVVIIIVESLSKEFVGSLNQGMASYQGYTPFVDTLIDHSLVFEHGIANCRRSIEALPCIMASIPSHEEAFSITPYLANNFNSLLSVLGSRGYYTSFYHGGRAGSMGFANFMKIAGANAAFSKDDYPNQGDDDGAWGIWDEPYLQYWAQEMNNMPQPFFSTVFTLSSHHPFNVPAQYVDGLEKGPLPIHRCVAYTDMALQKFFSTASKMPWYANTVFVVTADHAAPYSHYGQYQNQLGYFSIPIIYFTPDSSLKGISANASQQCDIFPTLVDYLGMSDSIFAFGNSALQNTDGQLMMNYYAGTHQGFYNGFMLQFDGINETGFYKYKDDPSLSNNLIGQFPEQEQQMLLMMKAYLQQYATALRQNKMLP